MPSTVTPYTQDPRSCKPRRRRIHMNFSHATPTASEHPCPLSCKPHRLRIHMNFCHANPTDSGYTCPRSYQPHRLRIHMISCHSNPTDSGYTCPPVIPTPVPAPPSAHKKRPAFLQ